MTLRRAHEDAVLTAEEIAMIRQALAACSNVLTWAAQHGSLQLQTVALAVAIKDIRLAVRPVHCA